MQVEVVYSPAEGELKRWFVEVATGATLTDVIKECGVLFDCPELDSAHLMVGVFGVKKPMDTELRDLDQIEIYRPLLLSPIEARKLRAKTVADKTQKAKEAVKP